MLATRTPRPAHDEIEDTPRDVEPLRRGRAATREGRRPARGMPVGAQADRQFRRAQMRPTRRRGWRRLLSRRALGAALIALVLVYAGYRAVAFVTGASGLRVDRIVVHGNARLSTGEVLAIVGGLRGQSIVLADLDAYRTRLLDSPWVAEASLRRLLPATVEIAVAERVPMGLGRVGSQLYLIDAGGVVIDEYGPQYVDVDLPIIDGLPAAGDGSAGIDGRHAALAAQVMSALATRPDLAKRVSQIDVTDAHDAVVILEGDPALLHLGEDRFVDRLQSYLELAPTLRARVPEIDYVDLRFDERVYVRPGGSPGAAPPAARRR